MPYITAAKKIIPDPMRVLMEKHRAMGGIARLKKENKSQDMFFTYFFPKLINPRKAATINRDPDPTKTVQFLHMKKAGRDSLRNKMLKINKINIMKKVKMKLKSSKKIS